MKTSPTTSASCQATVNTHDEHILVVKRELLFKNSYWQGIKTDNCAEYIQLIEREREFLPRNQMEQDPTYKQIIPYLVFRYQDTLFLMQRMGTASEQRLRNKMSLGIGGHVRQEDMTSSSVLDWALREFHEEVSYTGSYKTDIVGLLNDDSNSVGHVHLGLVILLTADSNAICVKSELKSGFLATTSECQSQYEFMESWSQLVFTTLRS